MPQWASAGVEAGRLSFRVMVYSDIRVLSPTAAAAGYAR